MTTEWFVLIGGLLAVGVVLAGRSFLSNSRGSNLLNQTDAVNKSADAQTRLEIVQKLNRSLVEANDEEQLMTGLLDLMISSTHTAGATYIPLDDLGEPLAQIHQGVVPEYPYQPWTAHLKTPSVRDTCRACQTLHKEPQAACPLAGNPYVHDGEITCLTIQRGSRRLGVINLYHQPGQTLDADEITFVQGLLDQTSLAVDNLRLHNQEVETLRQLQMVHRSTDETSQLFSQLLDSICAAVSCDIAILSFSGNLSTRAALTRSHLSTPWHEPQALREIISRVQSTGEKINLAGQDASIPMPGLSALVAVPLQVPGSLPAGCLVTARVQPEEFSSREERIIETIASQAALVIDNERKVLDLEYRAVMDERSRLAREIHDGLAQTLAFLKMQAGQMSGLLQKGEMTRLAEMLRTNQQILNEAYTDTRQAINHLRLSPQPGVKSWLKEAVMDFRRVSQIDVDTELQQDPENLPIEIQSQLIRIIQEALNNIRKHARAGHVWISFHTYLGDLVLEIHDDGRGFLAEDVPSLSQYGLRGMRERAEMIGAEFQIISQPGSGTTIRLQLPYAYSQEAPL